MIGDDELCNRAYLYLDAHYANMRYSQFESGTCIDLFRDFRDRTVLRGNCVRGFEPLWRYVQ